MFAENVTFTHSGTPESVIDTMKQKVTVVGFTNDSGVYVQVGTVTDFMLSRQSGGSNLLLATIYSDSQLDFSLSRTFTVTGQSVGTLTVVSIEQTTPGFPFFF